MLFQCGAAFQRLRHGWDGIVGLRGVAHCGVVRVDLEASLPSQLKETLFSAVKKRRLRLLHPLQALVASELV